jgi:signal transduction histidine kinase
VADPAARARPRRRLYLRIYLVVLGIVATLQFGLGVLWHLHTDPTLFGRALAGFGAGIDREMHAALDPSAQQAQLDGWAARMGADLALYAADGTRLGSSGNHQWPPDAAVPAPASIAGDYTLSLSDGRLLAIHPDPKARLVPGPVGITVVFVAVALLVGAGCYPLVRGLTRRLEQLQRDVETWDGASHLPRVTVEGHDEIAALATSFNRAAQRIEDLLRAQKSLVANASHELRSPLARIRLAIELLPPGTSTELRREIARNISELDALVDEVLLSSRLDALGTSAVQSERVCLAELIGEVAREALVSTDAEKSCVEGDPRLLRRLLRNLAENAARHGRGSPVEVRLHAVGAGLQIDICDRGPGVPHQECERIFEPFYRAPGASEADGGVGLGLSIVRRIAHLHGGRVACMPRQGGGSCFQVWLPTCG